MIKKLASYVKEYKKAAILTPLFVILEVVMEVIIPLLMAKIIDVGIANSDVNYIVKMGIFLTISAIMSLIFGMLSGAFAAKASAGFAKNLRKAMFYKVQDYSFENIDKFSTSSLITRMTTDVTRVQMAFQMIIRILVRGPIMMIFALLMVLSISAKLSLVFLVAIPVLAAMLIFISLKAHPIFEAVFKKYDKLNRVVQENLSGIRVVKAFVREKTEEKKFQDVNDDIKNYFVKAEKIVAFNSPVMQLTIYTCILVISWIGSRLIVGGAMQTGQLSSIITYAWQILSSLMMLSMVFVMITMSIASAERICEVLDEKSDLTNPENPVMEVKDGSIEFDNVVFRYNENSEKAILQDINVKIPSGSVVGILGGTGAGKTSFVNLISRLYDVSSGSVKVGGLDVRQYDMEALRDQVSVVLQKNVLFSGTFLENLRWGKEDATLEECIAACKIANAHEFISARPDGYNTHVDQGGVNVSGGQKQRICIARALLKDPKILILDDSTSAVDTATDARIRDALKAERPDMTKIIIAQRISSMQHADIILVMDDGMIVDRGTHEELLQKNEIYREIYESQQSGDFDENGGEL